MIFAGVISVSLFSCGGDDTDSNNSAGGGYVPSDYRVSGNVEKGPFISGSVVTMQPMNHKLQSVGSTYSATISDDYGSFAFNPAHFDEPFASLNVNGYFYNEYTGKLSNGPIILRAIVDLRDKQSVNVNLLTHLKYQRIMNLTSDGKSFAEANKQAQQELLAAFGLQKYNSKDVSQYSIASGTDESAALIVTSAFLLGKRTEAEFTEYLAKLSADFAEDGVFSDTNKEQMKNDKAVVLGRLDDIKQKLIERYKSLGRDINVPDLKNFGDWNDDGIVGNDIYDPSYPVTLSQQEISAPKEGGHYEVKIESAIPLFLTPPGDNYANVEEVKLTYGYIKMSKEINNNVLIIDVQPAAYRVQPDNEVILYDAVGTVVTSVTVHQEGNPEGKYLSSMGESFFAAVASRLSEITQNYCYIDFKYGNQLDEFRAPVYPDDTHLRNFWNTNYELLRLWIEVLLRSGNEVFEPVYSTYAALCYYRMAVFFGALPYIDASNVGNYDFRYSRTEPEQIFGQLEPKLKQAIDQLPNRRMGKAEKAEDMATLSKDVAHVILADIYMFQHRYQDARTLLKAVVDGGYYELDSETRLAADSREVLFGIPINNTTRSSHRTPQNVNFTSGLIMTYTDVLLSLAECEFYIGNSSAAEGYVRQVTSKKQISLTGSSVIENIQTIRNDYMETVGEYFSFLKRNNLAENVLNLQPYQLLLPIPDYSVGQNPGY